MISLELIVIIAFVTIVAIVFAVGRRIVRFTQDPIAQRLAQMGDDRSTTTASEIAASMASHVPQLNIDNSRLDRELQRAGYYQPTARRDFCAMRNLLVMLTAIITGTVVVGIGPEQHTLAMNCLLAGCAVTALVWATPRLYLVCRGNQRAARVHQGLPDALDMLTMGLSGGLALPDALSHVTDELYAAHPDLAVEWVILGRHAELISFEKALNKFAERMDDSEIHTMSALLTQGQRLGTNMVGAVYEYADGMRTRRRQLADEHSSKTSVRMLFPITICLLPSVFIILTGPAMLELWKFLQTFDGGVPPVM